MPLRILGEAEILVERRYALQTVAHRLRFGWDAQEECYSTLWEGKQVGRVDLHVVSRTRLLRWYDFFPVGVFNPSIRLQGSGIATLTHCAALELAAREHPPIRSYLVSHDKQLTEARRAHLKWMELDPEDQLPFTLYQQRSLHALAKRGFRLEHIDAVLSEYPYEEAVRERAQ